MYINLPLLESVNLTGEDLINLIASKQAEVSFLEKMSEDSYNRLLTYGYIKHINAKNKKEHKFASVRLSDSGKKILVELSFEGVVDEETKVLAEWVKSVYKNKSGGIVKNAKELERRIHWFKTITNIKGNFLAILIQHAMQDTYNPDYGGSFAEYKNLNPRAILSNLAENLFWMPSSIMDKHKTLDKSPLYTYYEDNKDYIENIWKKTLDEEGNKL